MTTLTKFKIQQGAVKVYIFLSGVLFTGYCGMLCHGMRHASAEFVGMTLAYALLFGAAWIFRLCWLSWAFLVYGYLIKCCIVAHRLGWFGKWIDLAHWIAFVTGAVLCVCLLLRLWKGNKGCGD